MNLATALAITAATLNLAMATLFLILARAPGWRESRWLARIALTAGLYNAFSLVFSIPGFPDLVYLAAGRLTYLVAALHCAAWLVYAFGGKETTPRLMPRPVRWVAVLALAASGVFAVTGLHLRPIISVVEVPWAGVRYHFPGTTLAGDLYGLLMPGMLALVFFRLAARYRQGERHLRWFLAGFGIYFICAIDEALVASRLLVFLSLADVGLLFVALPLLLQVIRRIMDDARRLEELSGRLEDLVRRRTDERDRAQEALLQAERLAALGRLAAGVGHEINNPLTYLQLSLGEVGAHLAGSGAPAPIRTALVNAQEGAYRIQKVVEGLRSYSRRQEERVPLDPREAVRSALKVAAPQLRHVARLETDLGEVPRVLGDEPRLVQALINLLVNAAQAVDGESGEGSILIRTAAGPDGEALITVADSGHGIAPEHIPRLSEPYFTTRAGQGGLGLGLFVTRAIIDAHGGHLGFESEPGRGTQVVITLPAAGPSPPPSASTSDPEARLEEPQGGAAAQTHRRRLLLVDDEPRVLNLLQSALGRWWDVTAASSGDKALELLDRQVFDAVICDLMMPGMSGMELAEELGRRNPGLRARTLFLTGGAVTAAAQEFLARPEVRYAEKPVRIARLNAALEDLLRQAPPTRGTG